MINGVREAGNAFFPRVSCTQMVNGQVDNKAPNLFSPQLCPPVQGVDACILTTIVMMMRKKVLRRRTSPPTSVAPLLALGELAKLPVTVHLRYDSPIAQNFPGFFFNGPWDDWLKLIAVSFQVVQGSVVLVI